MDDDCSTKESVSATGAARVPCGCSQRSCGPPNDGQHYWLLISIPLETQRPTTMTVSDILVLGATGKFNFAGSKLKAKDADRQFQRVSLHRHYRETGRTVSTWP